MRAPSRQPTRRLPPVLAKVLGFLCLAALLPLGAPDTAAAQQDEVSDRRMGVRWVDRVPHLTFSARDLVRSSVRRKLDSGLPQTIVMRTYAYPARGRRPIAIAPRSCRVVFDLWEEVYRVQIQTEEDDRSVTVSSMNAVLERCLVSERVPVGDESHWQERGGEDVYFAVLVELNPLSSDTVQRIRRWLARPAGGRVEGEAFFGSFVSLFVNRRIGEAERTIRFRSQAVGVPP